MPKRYSCACGTVIEGDDVDNEIAAHQSGCSARTKWWEVVFNEDTIIWIMLGSVLIVGAIASAIGA